ncbi:hypothetical protein [Fibrella forsythiae]|uniref:Uncharacterized protein n=1 Tax=Fibrella forsythiae TaxID=2817061 RepID=A0ABS3JE47_9BACT|nr:hypothetical protein [Fibrella forsythiae]MBO0947731.1 hypothetical protein [Fibrella forsythiae]
MQSIRTTINQKHHATQPVSFWTTIRLIVAPFINANADTFEALSRVGQPFGGNVTRRV